MPDFHFNVTGVSAGTRGLIPLFQFALQVSNTPDTEIIHSIIVHAQIQIQSLQRSYNPREKARLVELFGIPERWGQTLRNQLWAQTHAIVPAFADSTETLLTVPCTYDLNVTAAKYFYALDEGEISLLFLFSGTVFYAGTERRLQVEQIPWEKECTYRMPVRLWHDMMEEHYPNSAWLYLQRDVFERLYDYKRQHGIATWDQTIERLLPAAEPQEVPA